MRNRNSKEHVQRAFQEFLREMREQIQFEKQEAWRRRKPPMRRISRVSRGS